jgi:hypothetical protein
VTLPLLARVFFGAAVRAEGDMEAVVDGWMGGAAQTLLQACPIGSSAHPTLALRNEKHGPMPSWRQD